MAEASSPPVAVPLEPPGSPRVSDSALRLVLFGMPAAGKSSLLGALAQAAQSQEHLLNGRLTDLSMKLAELQRRVYEEKSRPTAEEVVPYAIRFEPYAADGQTAGKKVEAVLIDCDGRVATDLLARRRALTDESPDGTLAREVLDADTLILVIDAAAPSSQVDADFGEFGRFLRLLERHRGQASEVGGLPVFLVLTKCDLLAGPEDTSLDWVEHIEERKRQVHGRFKDFLERHLAEQGPLPFGQISLNVWATAVKRPALGPSPAKPREPYGVAELFRQAMENAQAHQRRTRRSGVRLLGMVSAAIGVLAVMVAMILGLVLWGTTHHTTPLQNAVEAHFSGQPTTSVRLRGDLQGQISILMDFMKDKAEFAKLPQKLQDTVQERIHELKEYKKYQEALAQFDARLGEVRSESELKSLQEELDKIKPPDKDFKDRPKNYKDEWQNTDAARLQAERAGDLNRLATAAANWAQRFEDLRKTGDELHAELIKKPAGFNAAGWSARVKELMEHADEVENLKRKPIPGSQLPYATVIRFKSVSEARQRWEETKSQLIADGKMGAALGLYDWVADAPPLLVIDPQTFAFSDVAARMVQLRSAYGESLDTLSAKNLPEPLLEYYRTRAQDQYTRLLRVGRDKVREVAPGLSNAGSTEARTLLDKVAATPDMDAFRQLAAILGPIARPGWEDPIKELQDFVQKPHFIVNVGQPTLVIEDERLEPVGRLKLYHDPPNEGSPPTVEFDLGVPEKTGKVRRYRPQLATGTGSSVLKYEPGQVLYAVQEVKNGDVSGWALGWMRGRGTRYRFDYLNQSPQLYKTSDGPTAGKASRDVILVFNPSIPRLPDLMP